MFQIECLFIDINLEYKLHRLEPQYTQKSRPRFKISIFVDSDAQLLLKVNNVIYAHS